MVLSRMFNLLVNIANGDINLPFTKLALYFSQVQTVLCSTSLKIAIASRGTSPHPIRHLYRKDMKTLKYQQTATTKTAN